MSSNKNGRVDVNTPTGSYTVDETVGIMEQETITKKTVELIVVRRDTVSGGYVPTVMSMNSEIHYTFPMTGVVSITKRTTIEEVLFNDTPSTIANLPRISQERLERLEAEADTIAQRKPRKPRKKETQPRAVCRATCCGAKHRRKSSIDGFCFDCRPSNSASREEVKY